jgi:hypothetical protein
MRVLRVPSPVREPPELRQADQTDFAILIQEDDCKFLIQLCDNACETQGLSSISFHYSLFDSVDRHLETG